MLPLALACLLIGALAARPLLRLARLALSLCLLAAAVRGLGLLLPELGNVDWGAFIPAALFGACVMLVGFRFINNALVERDRRADKAGVDKKHDARLI